MNPFTVLGLAAGADEAAIKRAYAQLLRQHRPDDDPEGFQRINEAYRAALAYVKAGGRRPAWNRPVPVRVNVQQAHDHPATGTPDDAEAARPAPAPKISIVPLDPPPGPPHQSAPRFDSAQFIAEFRKRCGENNARTLARWLSEYPALWNLPIKHNVGRHLLRELCERPIQMSEDCFAATSDFFHFDDALAGINALQLRSAHARCTLAWLVHVRNYSGLAQRLYTKPSPANVNLVRTTIKLTRKPLRWWNVLLHAFHRRLFQRQVGSILTALCDDRLDALPPPIDKAHAHFWMQVARPELNAARLLIYAYRSIAALALIPLAIGMIPLLAIVADNPTIGWSDYAQTILTTLLVVAPVVAIAWLVIGAGWLDRTLEAKSTTSRKLRIALFSATPALCVAAFLVGWIVDPLLGLVVALGAMFIALMRCVSKHRPPTRSLPQLALRTGAIFIAIAGFNALSSILAQAANADHKAFALASGLLVAVTLAIWAWDWRRRGFLTPRT